VIDDYLANLVTRVEEATGPRLVGVYLMGSAALGDFDAATSDLDVQAVTTERLAEGERRDLAARLTHAALPVPVRGLEFVLYARDELDPPRPQLNLNTGPRMTERLDLEPDPDEWFWFVLDVAIGREPARALAGPPAAEVFPPVRREHVLEALRASEAWHAEHADPERRFVAAARARAWRHDGRWRSKREAVAWARAH
jgi:hypothetical protein